MLKLQKQERNSDDAGLRSPVIETRFPPPKSAASIVACVVCSRTRGHINSARNPPAEAGNATPAVKIILRTRYELFFFAQPTTPFVNALERIIPLDYW